MPKFPLLLLVVAAVVMGAAVAWSLVAPEDYGLPDKLAAFSLEKRPQSDRFLFDYAGALRHYEEGAHRYLGRLGSRFHIEALIVTVWVPSSGNTSSASMKGLPA